MFYDKENIGLMSRFRQAVQHQTFILPLFFIHNHGSIVGNTIGRKNVWKWAVQDDKRHSVTPCKGYKSIITSVLSCGVGW